MADYIPVYKTNEAYYIPKNKRNRNYFIPKTKTNDRAEQLLGNIFIKL